MLARAKRLSTSRIQSVLKRGQKVRGRYFSLRYLEGEPRFAAVVSLKVAKKAVVRNKLRRLMYAVVGEHPHLPFEAAILLEKVPEGEDNEKVLAEDLAALLTSVRVKK